MTQQTLENLAPGATDALLGAVGDAAQQAAGQAADLPWGAEALAVAGLLVGLALWIAGRRVLRPFFALAAAALLGAAGFFLPAGLGASFNPHLTLAVGAVVGAAVGLLLYRFAMALTLAIAMGALSPTLFAVATGVHAPQPSAQRTLGPEELALPGVPMQGAQPPAAEASTAAEAEEPAAASLPPDQGSEAARRVRAFLREASLELEARWVALPLNVRLLLLGVAATGALVGFLTGMAFPKPVALMATAIVGPLLWVPCGLSLASLHGLDVDAVTPHTAQSWLLVWLVLSAVGMATQWTAFSRKADSAASDS
ncbi:MAG: hypothetical protein D6824_10205 [Planctomycetota bacterium]|nr:MAG: hypothetical protein D6824_10205 [Planctomycetota bacterium]